MVSTALTLAGSDPSGGAGVQSDLKTFSTCGVYGLSVITALTAQNTEGVAGILPIPVEFVTRQLDTILADFPIDAAKTGMLGNTVIVETIAEKLRSLDLKRLVIDPVMISSSGTTLLDSSALHVFKSRLLPLSLLITPNTQEAGILAEMEIHDLPGMEAAARKIQKMGAANVLVKGGHLCGDAVDVLFDGVEFLHLRAERIGNGEVHGTGCVLSAAITANLARGDAVAVAVSKGKEFVTRAIANAIKIGHGARLTW